MRVKNVTHAVDLLFSLALFCLFAATALAVVLLGANVYQRTVEEMERNNNVRASLTYLAEKVRQNDRAGAVRVEAVAGEDALVLSQAVAGEIYETWLFLSEGELREVLVKAGTPILPEAGQPVTPLEDWELSVPEEGLLRLIVRDGDGNSDQLLLAPRCALEG